ncbi:hypothetical protein M5G20_18205 [Pseudomonas sp. TNT2022 ID1044]|uniref:hypothetical protein n=1 Tax=Pseudomonas sp. TNT2022 ID1044 TaxID=2942636 RepID=UPI00235F79D8|nr:hypothetical protein [Pseudomonas sp. TNT2022 ID1044]MDD0997784.1 hypothetical protein [Pseudomonas sp. TNT2022 ID1044]
MLYVNKLQSDPIQFVTDESALAFKVSVMAASRPILGGYASSVVLCQFQVNFLEGRARGFPDAATQHLQEPASRLLQVSRNGFLSADAVIFRIHATAGAGQRHVVVWLWSNR